MAMVVSSVPGIFISSVFPSHLESHRRKSRPLPQRSDSCSYPVSRRPTRRTSSRNLLSVEVSVRETRAKKSEFGQLFSQTIFPVSHDELDYSQYQPRDMRNARQSDPDNFFHGVLNYISFNSGNKYNQGELLIEYKGIHPNSDPGYLLDYRSPEMYESGPGPGQFLVFTFRRIAIKPTAYAIKSGPLNRTTRHLTSYVLQGCCDPLKNKWEVIDERQMLLEYMPAYTAKLWHVDTDKSYQKFRLLQTDPAPPPGTHFAISAFEIHGSITIPSVRKLSGSDAPNMESFEEVQFDPWSFKDRE